jgi:hypothetical protein
MKYKIKPEMVQDNKIAWLDKTGSAPAEMKVGDRGALPTAVVVVSRFPKL